MSFNEFVDEAWPAAVKVKFIQVHQDKQFSKVYQDKQFMMMRMMARFLRLRTSPAAPQ